MFNEESGEENKNSRVKSFIGGMAKKKGKQVLKKVLMKILIPWGLLICFALFIIIFCIGAAKIGTTGEHTFSDTMNKYDNKALEDYLKTKVKNANGSMDDYYGMAKRVSLTEGNVEGFISLAELETGKDINKMMAQEGLKDVDASELVVSKYTDLLKPDFTYKDDYIVTTTTTDVKDSDGKTSSTTKTDQKKIKLLYSADTIKGAVDITYKTDSLTSKQTSTRTYEVPVLEPTAQSSGSTPTTANVNSTPTVITAIDNSNGTGAADTAPSAKSQDTLSTSKTRKVTETTTITTKVDTPIVDKVTESKKNFERLKSIIQSEFPNEKSDDDLNMCVHYVIKGTGSDYDTSEQDGDWMNSDVDDNIVDDIMGEDGGFTGIIPLFRQTDPRWANIPFGDGTIATSGCGPTSFAMVVSGLGGKLGSWDLNGDGILDPGEAAKYAQKSGYDTRPCAWALFEQESAGRFGLTSTETKDSNSVYSALQEGYPVVASMHGGKNGRGHFTATGHFIVLTGVDSDGQVLINDPNPANGIDKIDMGTIVAEANVFWIFKNPNAASGGGVIGYRNVSIEKLQQYLTGYHSMLVSSVPTIVSVCRKYNVNPLFVIAITRTEQSFVPIGSNPETAMNPYNVYHSWMEYHPGIEKSTEVCCQTLINLSKGAASGEDIYEHIGKTYCETPEWGKKTEGFMNEIARYINSH